MTYLSGSCRFTLLLLFCIAVWSCAGAPKFSNQTGFYYWDTYVDNLDSGSHATGREKIISDAGIAEVTLVKAADPPPGKNNTGYPYAGLFFGLSKSNEPVNLTGSRGVRITYRMTGQISFILSQKGIQPGHEYRSDLPESGEFTTLELNWNDFSQPDWIEERQAMDLKKINGLKFQVTAPDRTETNLAIKSFEFK